jgi:hypothetical protein
MNMNMNMKVLSTASFIVFFVLAKFSWASESTPIEEDASAALDPIRYLEEKMPIYTYIYRMKNRFTEDDEDILQDLVDNRHKVNDFPHIYSALHRAIEKMDADLVRWLVENGAEICYGLRSKTDKTILSERDRSGKPELLIAHLETNFQSNRRDDAIEIMHILSEHGYQDVIIDFKAKKANFIEVRKVWANQVGIDEETLQVHPNSVSASLAASTNASVVGDYSDDDASVDSDEL